MCEKATTESAIASGVATRSSAKKLNGRKKLWQLHSNFHCSIIGTCLSLDEIRQAARKFHLIDDQHTTDFQLHSMFVSAASEAVPPSRYIQKFLDKKYQREIKRYSSARTTEDFDAMWQASLQSGDIAGAFWAVVTHPRLDHAMLQKISGEVHMLSHLQGASTRNDIKSLGKLRERSQIAQSTFSKSTEAMAKKLRDRDVEIEQLRQQIEEQQARLNVLEKAEERVKELEQSSHVTQLETMVETLSDQLFAAVSRANQADKRAKALEAQFKEMSEHNLQLRNEITDSQDELEAVESTLRRLLHAQCATACDISDSPACPLNNLKGRAILYVGGRASQYSFFRTLVEQFNGTFLYHDGGKEDSRLRLNTLLAQSDVVVCPTDCVSHDAYYRAKRYCDKLAKPLVMIPHASLSSFTRGLNEVAA